MLAVTVELLHGTMRADPDGLAHTGQLRRGEWPPSPLRLLAAFVSADGTRERCRHTDGSELAFLEGCGAPVIYADPPQRVHHQPLQARYVVAQTGKAVTGTQQEYIGRRGAAIRPGVRVAPATARVLFVWDVDVPDSVMRSLALRAARIGYLGAADSPVRVKVSDELAHDLPEPYEPDPAGQIIVGVPAAGVVAVMDAHFDRWTVEGASVTRSQSPGLRRLAAYRAPGRSPEPLPPEPTVIWMRLAPPVSGRRVSDVTKAFKDALLVHYQQTHGDPPDLLHGHGFDRPGYELARFLALPDVGHSRSRGRIHGLALWLPPGEPTVEGWCRDALQNVTLYGAGFSVGLTPWAGEDRPWAANPKRWRGPARRWATVFPALHERRVRQLELTEVARWCAHAGLPEPSSFRASRSPLIPGGVDLRPAEVNRPGREPRPFSHVELIFDRPVDGPVVIGAGRQRGLGLCAPLPVRTDHG